MSELLKKLNLLVKTSLSDLVPELPGIEESPARRAERQLKALDKRIEATEALQGQARALIAQFEDEIAALDVQADQAVGEGREEIARYALEQQNRARQRLTIAQAELRDIQRAVADLTAQARDFALAVERAKQQAITPVSPPASSGTSRPTQTTTPAPPESSSSTSQTPAQPPATDDDLERRKQRLSKR